MTIMINKDKSDLLLGQTLSGSGRCFHRGTHGALEYVSGGDRICHQIEDRSGSNVSCGQQVKQLPSVASFVLAITSCCYHAVMPGFTELVADRSLSILKAKQHGEWHHNSYLPAITKDCKLCYPICFSVSTGGYLP